MLQKGTQGRHPTLCSFRCRSGVLRELFGRTIQTRTDKQCCRTDGSPQSIFCVQGEL
jgi:hypothetical protein